MNNGGYLVLNAPIVIKGSGCTLGKIANGRVPQEKLVFKKNVLSRYLAECKRSDDTKV